MPSLRNIVRHILVMVSLLEFGTVSQSMAWAQVSGTPPSPIVVLNEAARREDWLTVSELSRAQLLSHKKDPEIWTYLGLAQLHLHQLAESKRSLARALQLAPRATYTHNNYGAVLEALGLPSAAAGEYQSSLKLNPDQAEALVNLARLRAALGTAEGRQAAHLLLGRAWELAPEAEIASSLVLTLPCAGLTNGAIFDRQKDAQKLEAGAAYRRLHSISSGLDQEPGDGATHKQLGAALLNCGLAEEAQQEYEAALRQDSSDDEAIVGLARAQFAGKHYADAGKTLETALRDEPDSAPIYALLADVYEKTGHVENAIPAMRLAIERAPDNEGFRFRYAMLLIGAHAPKAAVLRMQEAVQRFPTSARLWLVLGLSEFESEDIKGSEKSFDRSLALDPDLVPALAYRGLVAFDLGRYQEARAFYQRALARDASSADLHCLMAEAIYKQNADDLGPVHAELRFALSLQSDLASAYLMLGRVDLHDQPRQAVEELNRALSLDSSLNEAHYYLARAYRMLHNEMSAAEESALFKNANDAKGPEERSAFTEAAQRLANVRF